MQQFAASPPTTDRTGPEALIRRHQAGTWHYLRLLGCTRETADDLTQEAFLVLLRKKFAGSDAAAAAFLRRSARFLFLEHRRTRRRGRDQEAGSAAWADAVDRAWENGEVREITEDWLAALRRCRDRLNGRRARAVELFYGERASRAEVARRLGMKETGVKTLLQRVRAELRHCVEEEVI